jgi:alkylation response protein AidB-like acyl-CoA dehydrogenase
VSEHYAQLGFATMHVPEALGGDGLSLATAAMVWEQIAAGDPAAPIALGVPGIASLARSRHGAALARARRPGAIVVTDELRVLDRERYEVAWAPVARPEWLAVVTLEGVALVADPVVEPLAEPPIGLCAAGASRVAVTKNRRDSIGDAAESARWLAELRVLAAACMLGAARDAAAYARRYARERTAFGRPIAHHQGLAFQLVEAATDLDAAGLLLGAAAAADDPVAIAGAYVLVGETAARVAERSLQALGGHGYLHDHVVEKRMRDIRALACLYGGAAAAERDAADRVLSLADPLELSR